MLSRWGGSKDADKKEEKKKEVKVIPDWPTMCPVCGSQAYLGLQFWDCTNHFCQNYKTPLKG